MAQTIQNPSDCTLLKWER